MRPPLLRKPDFSPQERAPPGIQSLTCQLDLQGLVIKSVIKSLISNFLRQVFIPNFIILISAKSEPSGKTAIVYSTKSEPSRKTGIVYSTNFRNIQNRETVGLFYRIDMPIEMGLKQNPGINLLKSSVKLF